MTYPRMEKMKLVDLPGHEKNPRKVTREALAQLERQIKELGNIQPITFNVRTKKIISGHQRLKCLMKIGRIETEVWCVDLDETGEKKAIIALNNHAGEWDEKGLADLMTGLGEKDVQSIGFTPLELLKIKESLISPVEEEGFEKDQTDDDIPSERNVYIVPIALTRAQHRAWEKKKEAIGIKSCKTAFLHLVGIES